MLVIAIMASSSMKLAKVNCPIESENDRIRLIMAARDMGFVTGSGAFYTMESGPRGTRQPGCRRVAGARVTFNPP
jgi:hypothetical protein